MSLGLFQLLDHFNSHHVAIQWPPFSLSWAREESPLCVKRLRASCLSLFCSREAGLWQSPAWSRRDWELCSAGRGEEGRGRATRKSTWCIHEFPCSLLHTLVHSLTGSQTLTECYRAPGTKNPSLWRRHVLSGCNSRRCIRPAVLLGTSLLWMDTRIITLNSLVFDG